LGANTFILVRIMEPFWFFAGIIAVFPMVPDERVVPSDASSQPRSAPLRSSAGISRLRLISAPPGKKPKPSGRAL
jgi:hypothetical protein